MGKQRVITPDQMGSEPSVPSTPVNEFNFNVDPNESLGNYMYTPPGMPTMEEDLPQASPELMQTAGNAYQSAWDNWFNNLANYMDTLHKSELDGERQMILRAIDEGDTSTDNYIRLAEIATEKAEYDQDIKERPVDLQWKHDLDRANALGSASMISTDFVKQLSEDLAGTLMYMGKQVGVAAAGAIATYLTAGSAPLIAALTSVGANAATAGVIAYTRHKESLAEVGDAYEQRMMRWEAEYLENNPQVTREQYERDRAVEEKKARTGIKDLYDRNMSLSLQDALGLAVTMGSWGPLSRMFRSGSRIASAGKYLAINPMWQYFSEGIWEEGSQYNWQKQYQEGAFDNSKKNFFENASQAYTEDLYDVISSGMPAMFAPDDFKLASDPEFNIAAMRGGKSAAIMGILPGLANSATTMYQYNQIKSALGENIPALKEEYNADKRRFFYNIIEGNKRGLYEEALRSHVKAGSITEDEAKAATEELDELERLYSKIDNLFFSHGSSLLNRTDKDTRREAFEMAGRITSLEKEKEKDLAALRKDASASEFETMIEDNTDNYESLIEEREKFWDSRIKAAKTELKRVARGDVRRATEAYNSALEKAGQIKDPMSKGKAIARAELDHNLSLLRRRKNIYGDEARNRVYFNNFKFYGAFLKNPTIENAQALMQQAAQTSTPVLSQLRQFVADRLEGGLQNTEELQKKESELFDIAVFEGTDEAWQAYDEAKARTQKAYEEAAIVDNIKNGQNPFIPKSIQENNGTTFQMEEDQTMTPSEEYKALQDTLLEMSANSNNPQEFQDNMILLDMVKDAYAVANEALTNDSYSNLGSLEQAIGQLGQFADFMKGNTKMSPKLQFRRNLMDLRQALLDRQEQVEKNANSNKVKSEKEFERLKVLGQTIFDGDGNVRAAIKESSVKEVREIGEKEKITTEDLITAFHLMTAEERKKLAEICKTVFDIILDELPNGIGQRLRSQLLHEGDTEMTFNLSFDPLEFARFSDVLNDDSLALVMRHGIDFDAIAEDIKSGNGNTNLSEEDLNTVISTLKDLKYLEFVIAHTDSKAIKDPSRAFEALQSLSSQATYPPNGEQTYLLLYLLGVLQEGNSVSLTGYAGSGKTVTIGNLISLLSTQGVAPETILTTAKLQRIRESMSEKTGLESVEFDKIADSIEGKTHLIIDEAGYLTNSEIEAIEDLKKKNPKLTILYVGDPNQLTEQSTIFSPLKAAISGGKIIGTPALTIVNRTPVLPIRDFQARFIGYEYNDAPVTGKHNIAGDTGLVVTDMNGALQKFKALKGSKIFITNKATKDALKADLGEQVVEAHEVQGMEFDHVVIALPAPAEKTGIEAKAYNTMMYVASTRAVQSIHFVTDKEIQNTAVERVPVAEMADLNEAKVTYDEAIAAMRGQKKPVQDAQEEAEEEADEEVTSEEESTTEETEETKESTETEEKEKPTKRREPPVSTKPDSETKVPLGIPAMNEKGEVVTSMQDDPDADSKTATTDGPDSFETGTDGSVVGGLPSVKARRRNVPEKTRKKWWKVPFPLSRRIKEAVSSKKLEDAFKKGPVQASVQIKKVIKEAKMYVDVSVVWNGIELGQFPLSLTKTAEAQAQINATTNPNHKAVLQAALDAYLEDPNFKGTLEIGELTVEDITTFSSWMSGSPMTLTKKSLDSLKKKIERTVYAEDNPVKTNHYVYLNAGSASGSLNSLIDSLVGEEQAAVLRLRESNPLMESSTKRGHPFLILTTQKGNGNWQALAIPIQPRKLRESDKIVTKIRDFAHQAQKLMKLVDEHLPEAKRSSIYGTLTQLISMHESMTDEQKQLFSPFIFKDQAFFQAFEDMKPYLTMLYKANRQLRKPDVKALDLTIEELIDLAYSFDEQGNSNFSKKGTTTKKGYRYNGVFIPVQFSSNKALRYNIDFDKKSATNVDTARRDELGHLFTIMEMNFDTTSVQASEFKRKKAAPTTRSTPENTPDVDTGDFDGLLGEDSSMDTNFRTEGYGDETLISLAEAEKIVRRLLPNATLDQIRFVTGDVVRRLTKGRSQWGFETSKAIVVAKLADGTIYKEVLRHELFHRVFRTMDSTTRDTMIRIYKLEHPESKDMSNKEIEEKLAIEFERYERKPESFISRLKSFFKRIANVLGFYTANFKTIDQAFNEIESGVFKSLSMPSGDNRTVNHFHEILDRFPDPQSIINVKNHISHTLAKDLITNISRSVAESATFDPLRPLTALLNNYRAKALVLLDKPEGSLTEQDLRNLSVYRALGVIPVEEGQNPTYAGFQYLAQQVTGIKGLRFTSNAASQLITTKSSETDFEEHLNKMLEDQDVNEEEKEMLRQDGWMIDSDNVDSMLTLTESVKLFTRLIPKYKGKEIVGVENSGKIYKVLSDMFQNFVLSPDQTLTQPLLRFLDERINETNDKSILAALKMIKALHLKAGSPTLFAQGKYVLRGRFEFLADPSDVENTGLLGSYAGATNDRRVRVVEQKNMSAKQFFSRIASEMKAAGYSDNQVEQAKHDFKVAEIQDLRNSIITHLGSPYKKNLMTAYVNRGKITSKRKAFAYEEAFVDNHRGRIVKQLQDPREQVFPVAAFNDLKNRIKRIEDFLFEDYKRIKEDPKQFARDAAELFQQIWEGTAFEGAVPNFHGAKDATNKMRMLKNYLQAVSDDSQIVNVNAVADTLFYFSSENVPSSVQDGSKSIYIYSPGSSATLAFRGEINKKNSDVAKRSPFFRFNPMATGNNMIRKLVQHLKIVELSNRDNARENTYSSETSYDYWQRQLNFSFIQQFLKAGNTEFISWVYTIADKPKSVGVSVVPVKASEKVQWIRQALDQEADLVNREVKSEKLLKRKANLVSNEKAEKFAFIETEVSVQEYMAMSETKKKNFAKKLLKKLEQEGKLLAKDLAEKGFLAGAESQALLASENYQELVGSNVAVTEENAVDFMVTEAYVQNYLIRHFTNQLIVGDLNVYKHDVDLIKRMSGPFAPGTQPISDKTFTTHTIADDKVTISPFFDPAGNFKELHGAEFDATDAQQFRSYRRTIELMKAMGSTADLGFIDKPVVDYVDPNTGEKFYHKMAVLTLTPSLNSMFYKAKRMSILMEQAGIHELNYKSASKAANLPNMATSFFKIHPAGNLEIPSTAYRQQLATTSSIGKSDAVVMPSQLVYHLLNSAEKNVEAAHIIYSEIAEIINSKRKLWEGKTDSAEKIVALVKSMTKDDPQNSIIYYMMEAMGTDALAVAGITTKINQLLLSKFYKEIQEIRFKGMKLQIVADTFADVFEIDGEVKTMDRLTPEQRDELINGYYATIEARPELEEYIKTMKKYQALGKLNEFYEQLDETVDADAIRQFEDKLVPRNLEYFKEDPKTGRKYAEVIMPNAYKKYLDKDGIMSHEAMKALGFRLPSTDLHSAIAIKAVAFYDENGQATPIIAPKEIVVLHGSDNDADTLNVIQKEVFKGKTSLKITDKLTYERGDIIGEKLGYAEEIAELEKAVAEEPTKQMRDLLRYARQNRIVDTFLDVITDPKNRKEMLTPIAFDPILDEANDDNLDILKEDMAALKKNRVAFINDPSITAFRKINALAGKVVRGPLGSPNSLIADNKYREINLAGKDLVGIYANGGKAVYLNMTSDGRFQPSGLADPLEFLGLTAKTFTQSEMYPGGKEGVEVSILQDIFVNFATDNAKVQALEPMNQNTITAPMTVLLNRLGVPVIYQTLLFNSPIIRQVTEAYTAMNDVTKRSIVVNGVGISLKSRASILKSMKNALSVEEADPNYRPSLEDALDLYTADLANLTAPQRKTALAMINLFAEVESLTNEFRNITTATSALNKSMKDRSAILATLEAVEAISGREEEANFPNDITEVPHLQANQAYLNFMLKVLNDYFLFNDPELFERERALQAYFGIQRNDEIGQRRLTSALEQFLMSKLPLIQRISGETSPMTLNKETLGSLESFKQRLVHKLLKLKRTKGKIEHEGAIMFLNKLSKAKKFAPYTSADLLKLTFDGKSLREDDEIYLVREGVRYLIQQDPALADELAAYTILEYGLQFQTNAFTKVMPEEIFRESVAWLANQGPAEIAKFTDPNSLYESVFAVQYIRANYVKTNINTRAKAISGMPGKSIVVQKEGQTSPAPVIMSQGFASEDMEDDQGRPIMTGKKFALRTHVKEDVAIYQTVPYVSVPEYDSWIADSLDPHKELNLALTNVFPQIVNEKIDMPALEKRVKELNLSEGALVRLLRAGQWPSLEYIFEVQSNGKLKRVQANKLDWELLRKQSESILEDIYERKSEVLAKAKEDAKAYREQKEKERKEAEELRNNCKG